MQALSAKKPGRGFLITIPDGHMEHGSDIKLVIWDLDDTIWAGTLLEGAPVSLKPFVKKIIETLDARGIMQSVASKNNSADALEKLKEFGLVEFFIFPEINWNAKSRSIAAIQASMNISMNAILFIDDQRFEREEVQLAHPEVACIDAAKCSNLLDHPRLMPRFLTKDAVNRRIMYLDESKRKRAETSFSGTPENFLASLNLQFIISRAKKEDLKRAEELTVRTNQLNATGVTYSYEELDAYLDDNNYSVLICELTDRYGSYGKIGLALVNTTGPCLHLKMLLMSCRVMARGVGTILLTYIMQCARQAGKALVADFRKTDRNRMMYITYKFSNFREKSIDSEGNILMENDLCKIPEFPPYIKVTVPNDSTKAKNLITHEG